MQSRMACVAIGLATAAGLSNVTSGAVTYSLLDLGDLPGGLNASSGIAINELGDVAGTSNYGVDSSTQLASAFRWTQSGGMEMIGSLSTGSSAVSAGKGINNSRVVVGTSPDPMSVAGNSSFYSVPGQPLAGIPGFPPNTNLANAQAVNNSGLVVGITNNTSLGRRAFRWTTSTTPTFLAAVIGSESLATAVNSGGSVAGYSVAGSTYRATVWAPDGTPTNLGRLSGGTIDGSNANGMNDVGQVVGQSGTFAGGSNVLHGFIYTPGAGMTDLGTLGAANTIVAAIDINNNGWVVGQANVPGGTHGFLWTSSGGMVDLNSLLGPEFSGWVITSANAINDQNQIAATATNTAGGFSHAVRLDVVPAPATSGMFLALGAAIVKRRRRGHSAQ